MEALLRVHATGIQHNDLRQSNILISTDGSEVRLIDFDEASEHQCRRRKQITLYTYPPPEIEVMCEEVSETAWVMTIWTPSTYPRDLGYLCRALLHIVRLGPVLWPQVPHRLLPNSG